MNYRITFDNTSISAGASRVHSGACDAMRGKRWSQIVVEAASATEAAAKFSADEELAERGYPNPVICKCCK